MNQKFCQIVHEYYDLETKDQPLAATDYVAKRRQIALDRGLGDKLAAAREAKKAKQMGE